MRRMSVFEASKVTGYLGGAGRGLRHRFDMGDVKEKEKPKEPTVADKKPPKKVPEKKAAVPFAPKLSARHGSEFKKMQSRRKFGK